MTTVKRLKRDLFGEVRMEDRAESRVIVRDCSRANWLLRPLARRMLWREARALERLRDLPGVPRPLQLSANRLERSWIEGAPLQIARCEDPGYFRMAMKLLRRMHRAGVAHNDLAKEPNLLVMPDGQPAFIDFQVASCSRRRGWVFRLLGREDLRHLLKHKRTYCRSYLTRRERSILESPSLLSRAYRRTIKPVYLFITRRILGWADREGAGDRNASL